MKRGCTYNLLFVLEKAPPETKLAMAECCIKSPAGTFCPGCHLIKEVKWVAQVPRTSVQEDGERKAFLPWPSPSPHRRAHLPLCTDSLHPAPMLHPPPFPNPQDLGGHSSTELQVSPQPWPLSDTGTRMASEYWRHSCFSQSPAILPFQLWNRFMSKSDFEKFFFFLLFRHTSFGNFFVPLGLSQTLPLLTLKSRSAWGDFSPQFGFGPVNHWGTWASVVSFPRPQGN